MTSSPPAKPPVLAFTQGDPAGIGPEILLKLLSGSPGTADTAGSGFAPRPFEAYRPLLIAEGSALEALEPSLPDAPWDRLVTLPSLDHRDQLPAPPAIPVIDPVAEPRAIELGRSGPGDAAGALAALDRGVDLVTAGLADALVTAPLSKESVARQVRPGFVGHTDYLAERAGLERYGRDYLMAFLSPGLQVALLTVHLPLRQALDRVTRAAVLEALDCLGRHTAEDARIALAGLNPHAGEAGLLGDEDARELVPAVAEARRRGLDVHGPESADSLFARARQGEFDWVLALYHDQGLIAVKTATFGQATNWTVGLPYLRTSVDHGTAFGIAGQGKADDGPLRRVVETTLGLLA